MGLEHIDPGNTQIARWDTAAGLRSAKHRFNPRDVLYGRLRPYLDKAAVARWAGICSTDILTLEPLPTESEPDFIGFLLHTKAFRAHAVATTSGVNHPRTAWSDIAAFSQPVPPLDEQRWMAAVLRCLEEAVDGERQRLATLTALKAATMAKLFREGLRGEPLKQTQIGEIPKGWSVVFLGDHCTIGSGGTPAREIREYWGGEIPWVKTGEINYRPIRVTSEHITQAGLANSSARIFPKGTLLMAMYGQGVTRGKVAFIDIDAATNQACAALIPGPRLNASYLYAFCCFAYGRIRGVAHGANQKNLSADLIRGILMPLPSDLNEQTEISRIITAIDTRLALAERKQAGLSSLFSSMLHLLMTGQVRVPPELIAGQPGAAASQTPSPEVIEEIVRRIIDAVAPEKIILFGSVVPGSPRAEKGVGLLVVMPFEGRSLAKGLEIERSVRPEVPLELLVRRPEDVSRALRSADPLTKGIVERGRLMHASTARSSRPAPSRPVGRGTVGEEVLRQIVQRIVEVAAPKKIILFGSAARGEMGPDSDIDLLVVTETDHPRETAQRIRQRLLGVPPGVPKDVIVVTPDHLERHKDTIGFIFRPALREGRILHVA